MNKNKVLNFYKLTGIIFSFIVLFVATNTEAYYEFQNLDATQTTICGFSTKTACENKLKEACGSDTTGICVESSNNCSSVTAPSCPSSESSEAGVSNTTYTLLAPIGGMTTAPDNFGDYVNKIFLIVIGLCAVLAVVMIVIGGVEYMGDESIFGKTKGRERIKNAIIGLVIALGAFAILNTINPDLLNASLKINGVTAEIDEEIHGDTPQTSAKNGYYCAGRVKEGSETTPSGRRWDSDSSERTTIFKNAGIRVQRDNSCKKAGESGCTSLAELVTGPLISWKNAKCPNCEVKITGGTECWLHSPGTYHFPGYSTVDIDDTPSMNAYVQSGTKQSTKSGYTLYTKDGVRFLYELNHYHIISW